MVENGKLKIINAEIPDLKKKILEFVVKRAEFKYKIAKLQI